MLSVTPLVAGIWPLLTKFDSEIVHPIYDLDMDTLLPKLRNLIEQADRQQYNLSDNTTQQLQLTVSATLRRLNCLVTSHNKPAGLPPTGIICGSSAPLLKIAAWHSKLIKKPALPRYRPDEDWMNFASWTEAATEIYNAWHSNQRTPEQKLADLMVRERDADLVDQAKVFKRLDSAKVFNWIRQQCSNEISAGRLTTLETLFTTDLINPLEWLQDDIDDLIEIVYKYCDPSHDIIHYIMGRCNAHRIAIREYNSGFTLLTSSSAESRLLDTPEQTAHEISTLTDTMSSFKEIVNNLTEAPVAPVRKNYARLVDFLKAQSEYNILSKLFAESQKSI